MSKLTKQERERLEKYVSVTPNAKQKAIEEMGFYSFVHFGMNTFTGKEWGDGKTPASAFTPTDLNTDQWCESLKAAGAKGVILTAKHHDGFCLWPTKTTEYCVRNSPYKNGKGDVVGELAESCRKYGLKLGLYLSPWDRNSEYYGTEKYNDFYIDQMTELLTNYGELFTIWLDGACGSHMDGKPMQEYDFKRYFDLVEKLQPQCAISNCGPDVRWVGNEGGVTRPSEWNVVPKFAVDVQKVIANSQQNDDGSFAKAVDVVSEDLGSREFLAGYDDFMWYPAEVDVSIRPGWFYHKSQDKMVRGIDNLLNIYYNSAGGNCMLLLNIPPDTTGRFNSIDAARLRKLGDRIRSAFADKADFKEINAPKGKEGFEEDKLISGGTYSPEESDSYTVSVKFDKAKIDKAVIEEDIDYSQRIENFALYTVIGGRRKKLYEGTTVGHKKIALFKKAVETDNLILEITSCRLEPYIKSFAAFVTDGMLPKRPKFVKLIRWVHKVNYKIYVAGVERAKKKQKAKAEKSAAKNA